MSFLVIIILNIYSHHVFYHAAPILLPTAHLRLLPFKVILSSGRGTLWIITLFVVHVLAEVVELGLVELGRKVQADLVLDVLERGRDRRHHVVSNRGLCYDTLECWMSFLQILGCSFLEQQIHGIFVAEVGKDRVKQGGDIVGLDDAPGSPDLKHLGEVNVPLDFFILTINDIDALHVRRQACCVGGNTQVLDESSLVFNVQLLWWEVAAECLLSSLALSSISRCETEVVSSGQCGCGNVFLDGFFVRPNTSTLFTGNILHNLVLNGVQNTLARLWVLGSADVCTNLDQECSTLQVISLRFSTSTLLTYQFTLAVPFFENITNFVLRHPETMSHNAPCF